jgi:hypothetical protein
VRSSWAAGCVRRRGLDDLALAWASVLSLELLFTRSRSKPESPSLRLFATQATSHPALIPQKAAGIPRPRPVIPARQRARDPLASGIPAHSRSASKRQDRPVTPEVAGSSPVAPVKYLQNALLCCLSWRTRPPASSDPAHIPHAIADGSRFFLANSRRVDDRPV